MTGRELEDALGRALHRRADATRVGPPPPLGWRPRAVPVRPRRSLARPLFAGGLALAGLTTAFTLGRRSVEPAAVVDIGGVAADPQPRTGRLQPDALPSLTVDSTDRFRPVSVEDSAVRDLSAPFDYLQSFGRFTDGGPPTLLFLTTLQRLDASPPLPSLTVTVGVAGKSFAVTRGPGLARTVTWRDGAARYRLQSTGLDERLVLALAGRARPRNTGGLDLGPPTARLAHYAEGRAPVSPRSQRLTHLGDGTGVTLRIQTASDLEWARLVAERSRTATSIAFERAAVAGSSGLLFAADGAAWLVWRPQPGTLAELRAPSVDTLMAVAGLVRSP